MLLINTNDNNNEHDLVVLHESDPATKKQEASIQWSEVHVLVHG